MSAQARNCTWDKDKVCVNSRRCQRSGCLRLFANHTPNWESDPMSTKYSLVQAIEAYARAREQVITSEEIGGAEVIGQAHADMRPAKLDLIKAIELVFGPLGSFTEDDYNALAQQGGRDLPRRR